MKRTLKTHAQHVRGAVTTPLLISVFCHALPMSPFLSHQLRAPLKTETVAVDSRAHSGGDGAGRPKRRQIRSPVVVKVCFHTFPQSGPAGFLAQRDEGRTFHTHKKIY